MSRGNRIGLAIVAVVVAVVGHTFFQVYGDRRDREQAQALLSGAEPYKAEVARAVQTSAAMPAAKALPRHARAMSARPDGTIVIEVADELFAGGRLTLRPVTNAKGEVMWTCSAEKIRPALLPAWCRG
jgi:hypothetical protein